MPKLAHIFFLPLSVLAASSCLAQSTHQGAERGMVVVRDAESGGLRMPTAAEKNAFSQQQRGFQHKQSAAIRSATPQPVLTIDRSGSRSVRVGERYMSYSVVTRNSEGGLDQHCVGGAHAAGAALTPTTDAGEHDHASH